ncbi:MAG: hypothetical protein M1817_002971 [Caeruleum heppii]|nr:MAG: hypothetical protein M1817_002971 [Caeruleum heppii]
MITERTLVVKVHQLDAAIASTRLMRAIILTNVTGKRRPHQEPYRSSGVDSVVAGQKLLLLRWRQLYHLIRTYFRLLVLMSARVIGQGGAREVPAGVSTRDIIKDLAGGGVLRTSSERGQVGHMAALVGPGHTESADHRRGISKLDEAERGKDPQPIGGV